MMSKKLYILVLAGGLMVSCDKEFLNIQPDSFISGSNYFRTESEIVLAVNGAYAPLQSITSNSAWILEELRTDNTTYQYNENDRRNLPMEQVDDFLMQENNPQTEAFWQDSYRGIARCNTILGRIGNVTYKNEQDREVHTGQALFLRALYYFHLVRLFGGVPLILQEVISPDNTETYSGARADKEQVYQQIIQDASEAAGKLPPGYADAEKGKATKGAAYTLLGEVYMTMKNYAAAGDALKKVTGYSLLADYSQVFNPSNKNHAESIFEVHYLEGNQGEGSRFIYRFAPYNSGAEIVGDNQLVPYEAGFNIPTHDMVAAYEPGDKRRDASIGYFIKAGNKAFDVALGDSIPYIRKYRHPHSVPGITNDSWPVYRYAQVLLMLAEALNEAGQTKAAYEPLDAVRARAGLDPLPKDLGQTDFRKAVYHEQQVELAFENHRWFDLLRTGRAQDVLTAHGERRKANNPRLNAAYKVAPYMLLYPIPARELKLNPSLEQNSGW